MRAEIARGSAVSGRKPVWATEAGFHNAMRGPADQPPGVSEQAAAVYLTRTFLQHFESGIRRTYAYELLDEKPDRRARPRAALRPAAPRLLAQAGLRRSRTC